MGGMRLLVTLGSLLAICWQAAAAEPAQPLLALPYAPGLDVESMDRSVDPCTDFYAFACNGWLARNPIPPDQAVWHVYSKLESENRQLLWGILGRVSDPAVPRSPWERKAGDYFAACMDEEAVEAAGA